MFWTRFNFPVISNDAHGVLGFVGIDAGALGVKKSWKGVTRDNAAATTAAAYTLTASAGRHTAT